MLLSLFFAFKGDSDKFFFTFRYWLSERERTTNIAIGIVRRVISITGAIKKRIHEVMYKTDTKKEAKKVRATTFANAKLEETLYWEQ